MPTIGQLIDFLQKNYKQNEPCAYDIWLTEDVDSVCEDSGILLTDEQKAKVLDDVYRNCEADCGINWDSIGASIAELFPNAPIRPEGFNEESDIITFDEVALPDSKKKSSKV